MEIFTFDFGNYIEKNLSLKKCVTSWRKYFPDAKITILKDDYLKELSSDNEFVKYSIKLNYLNYASLYLRFRYMSGKNDMLYFDPDIFLDDNFDKDKFMEFLDSKKSFIAITDDYSILYNKKVSLKTSDILSFFKKTTINIESDLKKYYDSFFKSKFLNVENFDNIFHLKYSELYQLSLYSYIYEYSENNDDKEVVILFSNSIKKVEKENWYIVPEQFRKFYEKKFLQK